MRKFNIIGGMPRAGTTLAAQLLSMNENFHVTPTSAILDTLKVMRSNFSQDPTWRGQDRLKLMDNFRAGMNGFLEGFFHDKDVVFDKVNAQDFPATIYYTPFTGTVGTQHFRTCYPSPKVWDLLCSSVTDIDVISVGHRFAGLLAYPIELHPRG